MAVIGDSSESFREQARRNYSVDSVVPTGLVD
jgi:hypothetical protein